jgi:hypothetical protein
MHRFTMLPILPPLLLTSTFAVSLPTQEPPPALVTCMMSEKLARMLADEFGEVPLARGLNDDGTLLTVFAAEGTSSWTMTLTQPTGVSCIIAGGKGFEVMPGALCDNGAAPV